MTRATLLALAIGAAVSITGCRPTFRGTSTVSTTVGNRSFKAVVDGPASVQSNSGGATFIFNRQQLRIEGDAVSLDGKNIGSLPNTATKVDIDVKSGRITVAADGKPVINL